MNKQSFAALYLKGLVVNPPAVYGIHDELCAQTGADAADIKSGLMDFKETMLRIFDGFAGGAVGDADIGGGRTVSLEKDFPGLIHPIYMLYCIGLCGTPGAGTGGLEVDGSRLGAMYKEFNCGAALKQLNALAEFGFEYSGVDITQKSFNLGKAGSFTASYPDRPGALIGMRALAVAVSRVSKNYKDKSSIFTVFFRCDYRALALPKKYAFDIRDVAQNLAAEEKEFFAGLDDLLLANNCKCDVKYSMREFIFTYTSKILKTVLFSIHISMDRRYIKLNSKLINSVPDLLSGAPEGVVEAVKNGWNCAKLNDPSACNPKCVNLRFKIGDIEYQKCRSLNFILPIEKAAERDYAMNWLGRELAGA